MSKYATLLHKLSKLLAVHLAGTHCGTGNRQLWNRLCALLLYGMQSNRNAILS